jgi:hypothetical protein
VNRIVTTVKALIITGHKPEEIGLITGCGNSSMITVREFNKLIVLNTISLVNFAVSGVKTLYCKALIGVEKEIINFFRNTFGRHIILVVLMGWEACPVALGGVAFTNGKYLSI